MLLRGVVSAALVAGGLGLLPAVAIAQSEPAAPAAAVQPAEPAVAEAEPACTPEEESETLTPVTPDPAVAEASAEPVEAHCSQNAGDQQYQDPFAGSKAPGSGGNGGSSQGGSGSSSQSTDTTTSSSEVVSQGAVAGQDTGATADPAGPSLPNTGLGLGGLVALGLPLLAGGIALRLRLA